jgi:hypothetical protein
MAGKSFKDYYTEDKTGENKKKKPVVEQATSVQGKAEEIVLSPTIAAKPTPSVALTEDITSAVKEILEEQQTQSRMVLESVTKVNEDIAANVARLVESSNETNNKLLEAIVSLSEKVAMLEGKLDEIKHLEIPTPIVNLQMPSKKTIKTVHRDKRGIITHIEESEQFDTDEDKEE